MRGSCYCIALSENMELNFHLKVNYFYLLYSNEFITVPQVYVVSSMEVLTVNLLKKKKNSF